MFLFLILSILFLFVKYNNYSLIYVIPITHYLFRPDKILYWKWWWCPSKWLSSPFSLFPSREIGLVFLFPTPPLCLMIVGRLQNPLFHGMVLHNDFIICIGGHTNHGSPLIHQRTIATVQYAQFYFTHTMPPHN